MRSCIATKRNAVTYKCSNISAPDRSHKQRPFIALGETGAFVDRARAPVYFLCFIRTSSRQATGMEKTT